MKGSKLRSRKLWVTIVVGVAFGILKQVGIDVPEEVLKIALAYLGCEAAVDIARAVGRVKAE